LSTSSNASLLSDKTLLSSFSYFSDWVISSDGGEVPTFLISRSDIDSVVCLTLLRVEDFLSGDFLEDFDLEDPFLTLSLATGSYFSSFSIFCSIRPISKQKSLILFLDMKG